MSAYISAGSFGVLFLGFHSFNGFFFLNLCAEHIEHIDDLHILVRRACQRIIDPAVRLAALYMVAVIEAL